MMLMILVQAQIQIKIRGCVPFYTGLEEADVFEAIL